MEKLTSQAMQVHRHARDQHTRSYLLITDEWSLSSMRSHMKFQLGGFGEPLITSFVRARVRAFSRMRLYVRVEISQ